MRIIHLTPYYQPFHQFGGPTYSIPGIVNLSEAFAENIVITLNHSKLNQSYEEKQGIHTKVIYLQKGRFFSDSYFFSPHLKRILNKNINSETIIHIHTLFNYFSKTGLSFSRMHKTILSPRGMLDRYSLTRNKWMKRLHFLFFDYSSIKHVNIIHFTAIGEKENVGVPLKHKNDVIIPNIMTIPNIGFKEPEATHFQFVYIGRLNRKKGLDISIKAFSLLPEAQKKNVKFNIYGPDDDDIKPELLQLIDSLGLNNTITINHPVFGDEKYKILNLADFFISTSHQENFGMSVMESLSVGTPVIISKSINTYPEIQSNDLGIVLEENTPDYLVSILKVVIAEGSKRKDRVKIRQYIIDHFSADQLKRQYQKMYESLV